MFKQKLLILMGLLTFESKNVISVDIGKTTKNDISRKPLFLILKSDFVICSENIFKKKGANYVFQNKTLKTSYILHIF